MVDCGADTISPVLEKYNLVEYIALVDSIRKGDLRKFNDSIAKYQDRFIRYVSAACATVASG